MTPTTTDRIEKRILLRSPRSRVWRALTDSKEFGEWFRAVFNEPFRAATPTKGRMTYPGYEHYRFVVLVEEMVPESRFSFRWHPGVVDPDADNSSEPMTLVTFTLEEAEGGTLLTLVESGYDSLPLDLRADKYRDNSKGWDEQAVNLETYLREHP